MARLLAVLDAQLEAASRGQPIDRRAALGVMQYMTRVPDRYHHPREDAMFDRLVKRDPGSAKRIAQIQRAHRTIGAAGKRLLVALERLEQGSQGDPAAVVSRIGDYAAAMREHMAIEERDLFPRARAVLEPIGAPFTLVHHNFAALPSIATWRACWRSSTPSSKRRRAASRSTGGRRSASCST